MTRPNNPRKHPDSVSLPEQGNKKSRKNAEATMTTKLWTSDLVGQDLTHYCEVQATLQRTLAKLCKAVAVSPTEIYVWRTDNNTFDDTVPRYYRLRKITLVNKK